MSRTAFCPAQPDAILSARNSPMPGPHEAGSGRFDDSSGDPELPDDSPCELGSDASHHARPEITSDALLRRGRGGLEHVRIELQPVCSICQPDSDGVDVLAGGDRRGMTDERNQVPFPARLDLEDRESRVRVVERHPFDATDQALATSLDLFLRLVANRPSPAARA